MIFLVDKNKHPLHPTTKYDMIRRWRKQGLARILKVVNKVVIVQVYKEFDKSKTIDCEFRIGIDPGYNNIGYILHKIYNNKITRLLVGQVNLRTSEITKLLQERKMFRNSRRHNRRKNVLRRFHSVKFRKPIWKNRRKHPFQPTHNHLIISHFNLLRQIFKLIPKDQVSLHIEYAKFDIHKIINPDISGVGYQNGIQKGFENVKSYIRHRDNYTCQSCKSQNIILEVHHIIPRENGGSDRPDNLITLCTRCHKRIQSNLKSCPKPISNFQYKDAGVLNSVMKFIYESLEKRFPVVKVFGYQTKELRREWEFEKSHQNDAMCISFIDQDLADFDYIDKSTQLDFTQFRRHNRSFTSRYEDRKYYLISDIKHKKTVANNRRKRSGQDKSKPSLEDYRKINKNIQLIVSPGIKRPRRNTSKMLFRPGDKVLYKKDIHLCTGWASTRSGVLLNNLGEVKQKLCKNILHNSGLNWH